MAFLHGWEFYKFESHWAPDALTPTLGGMLADLVLEPAMQSEGTLARALGWLVGTGPGAGMSLLMIFFGLCTMLTLLSGYLVRRVRNIEVLLPDHDQSSPVDSDMAPA